MLRCCVSALLLLSMTPARGNTPLAYPFEGPVIQTQPGTVKLQKAEVVIGKYNVDFSEIAGTVYDNDFVEKIQFERNRRGGTVVDLWVRERSGPTSAVVLFEEGSSLLMSTRFGVMTQISIGDIEEMAVATSFGSIRLTKEKEEEKVEEKVEGKDEKQPEAEEDETDENKKMKEWLVSVIACVAGVALVLLLGWLCCCREQVGAGLEEEIEF